jgi:tetratricopeptide (TPR) repeat protein
LQGRYKDALDAYTEVKAIFSTLGEPRGVATAWHQIGRVHQESGQYRNAEDAYRQSLAIKVSEGDRAGQASTLGQLGNLYDTMGRTEESIPFLQQAADIYTELKDLANEGKARGNLAIRFLTLKRYDDARRELERAIECFEPFGHAASPWKTWDILYDLETACNQPAAAKVARQKAIDAYASYRRDGGVSQSDIAELYEGVAQVALNPALRGAVQSGDTAEIKGLLKQTTEDPDTPDLLLPAIDKLLSIVGGDRNPQLADDPDLSYVGVVELKMLLERLA